MPLVYCSTRFLQHNLFFSQRSSLQCFLFLPTSPGLWVQMMFALSIRTSPTPNFFLFSLSHRFARPGPEFRPFFFFFFFFLFFFLVGFFSFFLFFFFFFFPSLFFFFFFFLFFFVLFFCFFSSWVFLSPFFFGVVSFLLFFLLAPL